MTVFLDQQTGILGQLRKATSSGGPGAKAAKKVYEAKSCYEVEGRISLPTTNNREARIANCIKYDLSNGYRLVTMQKGRTCIFLYFGSHDQTQRWLDRNRDLRVTVDKKNQSIRLINSVPPEGIQTALPTPTNIPFLKRLEKVDWTMVLPDFGMRKYLMGIDEDTPIKEITEAIDAIQQENPELSACLSTVFHHLTSQNLRKAQSALDLYLGDSMDITEKISEEITTSVLSAPSNSESIINLSDLSDEEWEKILDPTRFQDWMVFLHPGQRRVVDEDFESASVLTGVSGSGKTCVLVHRAKRLAEAATNERVLILTLNKSLARLIGHLVSQLSPQETADRIDVRSLHGYLADLLGSLDLAEFLNRMGEYLDITKSVESLTRSRPPQQLSSLFKARPHAELFGHFVDFIDSLEEPLKTDVSRLEVFMYGQDQGIDFKRYLYEELELVRSAFPCYEGYSEYLGFERHGRSIQFHDKRRQVILNLLRAWQAYQVEFGFLDHMMLCQTALLAIEESNQVPPQFRYAHVLVDEFQDISTLDLRLLTRVPTSPKNPLFLTGDFAQKIYAKELNFPKANLGPPNRTLRSIRKNYRNSRQILEAADALIKAFPPTFTKDESSSILEPEFATRESARPIAIHSEQDAVLVAWRDALQWLEDGHASFSVCIATANPESISVEQIREATPEGVESTELTENHVVDANKVVISDLTNIKGFEFSLMIIVAMDSAAFPPKGRATDEKWRDALRLYVSLTRARDEARLIYSEAPSEFLTAMEDKLEWQTAAPVWVAPAPEVEVDPEPSPDRGSELTQVSESDLDIEPELEIVSETEAELIEDDDASLSEPEIVPEPQCKYPVQMLNGMAFISVPRGLSQREVAIALNKNLRDISLCCQLESGVFVTPNDPLGDHIVENIFRRYGTMAAFR
jgi:superfamily I DNA/RNA helicase